MPTAARRKAPDAGPPDGWDSWGKHVLSEIERLSRVVESVNEQVIEMRQDGRSAQNAAEIKDLKAWRREHDSVATPTQLGKAIEKIEDLKVSQVKGYTLISVAQVLITALGGIVLWWLKK